MLNRDTTFIIGAGGSFDFGFPLGDKLRDCITDLLKINDPNISTNFSDPVLAPLLRDKAVQEAGLKAWPTRLAAYRRAASIIIAGLPFARSIDTLLDGLRDDPDVEFLAKLAIATVILRAEHNSPLTAKVVHAANADQIVAQRLKRLTSSWHAELGQILYEGHTRHTLEEIFQRASFVIFNYDRCIEEFLTTSLMRRFAVDRARALAAVAKCRIVHPYGQVGGYFPDEPGHVPFGACEIENLLPVASGIKTFTESMEEATGDEVKDAIARAETLVFMGFGWLPQNMELLTANGRVTHAAKVFATALGMEVGEIMVVADQIDQILRRAGHSSEYERTPLPSAEFIYDRGDCKALMQNCWLRLTSG
jgi:hypothetical protein